MSSEAIQNYRRDIDGLRAISVLIVLAFHAFPEWVPGGFIGVDVFFVISGFLITGIILNDIDADRFTILRFYHRRIRRIFPALVVVLFLSLIAGWVLLSNDEYKQLGWHVFASGLFFQNITLFSEAGYFDIVADYKPLLHLWSLSVEEQFYFVFPLFIFLVARTRLLAPAVTLVALLSFGACMFQTYIQGEAVNSFFLPHYRFWELMAGSLVQIFMRSQGNRSFKLSSVFGVLLLSLGVAFTSRSIPFPGFVTLLPVVGAMCVLMGNQNGWFSSRLLGSRPMVAIGLISYPLYLFHWPLFSFARILTTQEPSVLVTWGLILASFALATLTYLLVERPLRFGASKSKRGWQDWRTIFLLSSMIAAICAGYYIFQHGGIPSRTVASNLGRHINERITAGIEIENRYKHLSCDQDPLIDRGALPACSMYGPMDASDVIVVWGDSHAEAWMNVFFDIAKRFHKRVIVFRLPGCAPMLDAVRTDGQAHSQNCMTSDRARAIVDSVQTLKPKHVFLVARWSLYANGWYVGGKLQAATHFLSTSPNEPGDLELSRKTIAAKLPETIYALAQAAPVTFIKTIPVLKADVEAVYLERTTPTTITEHRETESFTDQVLESAMRAPPTSLHPITVLDPAQLLCATDPCAFAINNTVMYKDDNHITPQGSLLFENEILRLIQ
jgi:peptidoglycan/LPS O-acetylase OafA/YrhL